MALGEPPGQMEVAASGGRLNVVVDTCCCEPEISSTLEPLAPGLVAASTQVRLIVDRGSSGRRTPRKEAAMDTLVERCAGLDVHQKSVTACVRLPDEIGGRGLRLGRSRRRRQACSPCTTGWRATGSPASGSSRRGCTGSRSSISWGLEVSRARQAPRCYVPLLDTRSSVHRSKQRGRLARKPTYRLIAHHR